MTPAPTLTTREYIVHHLTNLNQSEHAQQSIIDFSLINIDTMFWSLLAGLIVVLLLRLAAVRATAGVPGRFQAAVELLVEFVDGQAKEIVHGDRRFVAPLALTVFLWVIMMNTFDLVPVDLVPEISQALGIHYMRIVPTADINAPLGMALGVLTLMIYYSFKIKGVGGFIKELFTAPFGANPILWPFNLLLNLIEYVAKTVSLGMRLFGNMFAGELLFCLVAMLGAAWTGFNLMSVSTFIGQVLAGSCWAIFHILIILLQGFIFMMLTLVYIGQAHDHH